MLTHKTSSSSFHPETGKPCGSAGEITNGQFIYTGVEFGDTVAAVCDEG